MTTFYPFSYFDSEQGWEEFIEAIDFMDEQGILNGSMWKIREINSHNVKKSDINGYSPEKEKINQRLIEKSIPHRAD